MVRVWNVSGMATATTVTSVMAIRVRSSPCAAELVRAEPGEDERNAGCEDDRCEVGQEEQKGVAGVAAQAELCGDADRRQRVAPSATAIPTPGSAPEVDRRGEM